MFVFSFFNDNDHDNNQRRYIEKKTTRRTNKGPQPKWKTRIENQIKGMRADFSMLSYIAQKSETENTSNQELQTTRESLKMKIQTKA